MEDVSCPVFGFEGTKNESSVSCFFLFLFEEQLYDIIF